MLRNDGDVSNAFVLSTAGLGAGAGAALSSLDGGLLSVVTVLKGSCGGLGAAGDGIGLVTGVCTGVVAGEDSVDLRWGGWPGGGFFVAGDAGGWGAMLGDGVTGPGGGVGRGGAGRAVTGGLGRGGKGPD